MPEQLTNSVDTTEQKVSKTKLTPEERSAKIQDMQEKVKQTKEKTDKLEQSDVKEAEELLQEHFGNKTGEWPKKFLNDGLSYAQAFKEKAEKKEFRANTMDTLKLLRTFNKERRNHMEKGDRNKAHEIAETFVTQLGKNEQDRKEKILDVVLMLDSGEQNNNSFTKEFNEPPLNNKEVNEIIDLISSGS